MSRLSNIRILAPLMALMILSGCTSKNQIAAESELEMVSVRAAALAGSDVGTPAENEVKTLRLMIFKSNAAGDDLGRYYNIGQNGTAPMAVRLPRGYFKFVVVANEATKWAMENFKSYAELKSQTINNYLAITPPLVMYAERTVNVVPGVNEVLMELERANAKVTLNVTCNYQNANKKIILDNAYISGMPRAMSLVPSVNSAPADVNSATVYFTNLNTVYSATEVHTINGGLVFYIPEYTVSVTGGTRSTLILRCYKDGLPNPTIFYYVILCDGMDQLYKSSSTPISNLTPAQLSISRNRHYKIDVQINTNNIAVLSSNIVVE